MSILMLVMAFAFYASSIFSQPTGIVNLLCNKGKSPGNIDNKPPRFSWQFKTSENGFSQSAFQLMLSDTYISLKKGTANVWNSGKINTDQEKQFELIVNIPANSRATVFVPAGKESIILVDGKIVKNKKDASPTLSENGKFTIRLKSGKYTIVVNDVH